MSFSTKYLYNSFVQMIPFPQAQLLRDIIEQVSFIGSKKVQHYVKEILQNVHGLFRNMLSEY